jgi:3',5'-cyclic AMP phosphodiesterase CpdA
MRILVTADLHFDNRRSLDPCRQLAREVLRAGGDVLVLAGDTAGPDLDVLGEALELFVGFPGHRLLVPGNHDLWTRPGESSLDRYESSLPARAAEHGFVLLDHAPQQLGRVGLVGSIGWYDYSFRDEQLDLPEPFYREKLSPAAARYFGRDDLLDAHRGQLTDRAESFAARWMDGWRVELGMSDEAFLERLCNQLAAQLDDLAGRVDTILAFLHHLPFAQLVPPNRPPRFAFAAAYLGAEKLGQVLRNCPKVSHVFCGHSHWPGRIDIDGLTVVNVGSTYVEKRLEVLDLPGYACPLNPRERLHA